jgi:pimeloyl-ACP methyl ester carboxylesterase
MTVIDLSVTRRAIVGGATLAGITTLGGIATSAAAQTASKTFVLVHGAWGGGWLWRRVADQLTAKGHKVFTPTLTGLGERSHLIDAKINHATHITDIVNVVKWENLTSIVLVGHSSGGYVITGVAEQLEPAISSIVFLDAFMPENGQSLLDMGPLARNIIAPAVQNGDIAVKPAPFALDVNDKDRAWVAALSTPQPIATFTDKISVTGARDRIAKKVYIRAKGTPSVPFDRYEAQAKAAGWHVHELPCRHMVMVDMPDELVELLVL